MVGLAQVLAGTIFFFAYNWAALPDLAKFALIEGAIALTALGALAVGLGRTLSRAMLVGASVLVGVLLAVVGQAYQTGADVYLLFMAWAVLILPWVIISRSAALWVVWFVIVKLAASLFADQVLVTIDWLTLGQAASLVGLVPCAALAAREIAVQAGCDWLSSRWTRLVPLGVALVTLFLPAGGFAVDYYESQEDLPSAILFVVFLAAILLVYHRKLPDYAAMVIGIGFADLFFILLGIRVIDEVIGFDFLSSGDGFLVAIGLMILWAGLGTGVSAVWMRRLRPQREAGAT